MKWSYRVLAPAFIRPELLLHPNIPKPLHGLAPRVIKGPVWWDKVRREAYAKNNNCCWACGVHESQAEGRHYLDAHECYLYDYAAGRLTFFEVCALCSYCHSYIHNGMARYKARRGDISESERQHIMDRGKKILRKHGLLGIPYIHPSKMAIAKQVPWSKWRMIIDGKAYGPTTKSYEAWVRGEWRKWKP